MNPSNHQSPLRKELSADVAPTQRAAISSCRASACRPKPGRYPCAPSTGELDPDEFNCGQALASARCDMIARARLSSSRPSALIAWSSPAAGAALMQTRWSCSTRAHASGRRRLFIATKAASSARKNSEVSAGTDVAVRDGLATGEILERRP